MVKKLILGTLLFGLIGILVVGAVVRTMDKTDQTSEPQGGHGRGRSYDVSVASQEERLGGGQHGASSADKGNQGQDRESLPGAAEGIGEAVVDEWVTLGGTVVAVDEETLTVALTDGGQMVLEGRSWSFAQSQGFATEVGDRLTLVGFFEHDDFEVGQIENLTSSQTVALRDETGRPLWAGRGRWGA